jgi:hypothetical protein
MDWASRDQAIFDRHVHLDGRPWTGAEIRAIGANLEEWVLDEPPEHPPR